MKRFLLTLVFVYFTWLLLVAPVMFNEKVHSIYSTRTESENSAIEQQKNDLRKKTIQNYYTNISSKSSSSKLYHQERLLNKSNDHVIIIIANKPDLYVDDAKNKYVLSQLLLQIDNDVKRDPRSGLYICNRSTENFIELQKMSEFYPFVKSSHTQTKVKMNDQEKLKHNYVDCLHLCLSSISYVPKYITVLRDTVVPYKHFLSNLRTIYRTQIDASTVRGDLTSSNSSGAYLYLQEPLELRKFSFEWASIRELIFVSLLGYLVFLIYFKLIESFFHTQRIASKSCLSFACFGAVLFFSLSIALGRPYLTELRKYFPLYYRLYEPLNPIDLSAVSMKTDSAIKMMTELLKMKCSNYMTFSHTWHHISYSLEVPGYVVSPSLVRFV